MHLAKLTIENFRIWGRSADARHLDLNFQRGLTLLVGENDSGKTAIIDALRLVLGTTSQDFLRINDDDFHRDGGTAADDFTIYCRFEGMTDDEAARFLEWLSFEEKRPILELTFRAFRVRRKNRSGAEVPMIEVTNRSGPKGEGRATEGEIRAFLRLTYLKPLRDAETEMAAGKGSRLSQLLLNHPSLKGQEQISDLPLGKADKVPVPPPTLRGIMQTADKWIQESPAIIAAKNQLNIDYLSGLSVGAEKLAGEITIGRATELKGILEKLELWLTSGSGDRIRRGLGLNNVLFMAAELLLLSETAESGLPLLLIEEPEAHLHPQLQMRLMEFFESKTVRDTSVQVILTTHSPNLSSKADIENITVVAHGRPYPLASGHTKLTPSDYRFLRRFLDTTKANLFFARGVMIVEGDAEDLLLPVIARLLGRSFTEHGVSIVKVGHRGLFRYARIFQRRNGPEMPLRVACIADRDIPPDEARDDDYVTQGKNPMKFQSDFVAAGKLQEHLDRLKKDEGGVVRTFPSAQWTFEHDLALAGLDRELHVAIAIAKEMKNRDDALTDPERDLIVTAANAGYDKDLAAFPPAQRAAIIYKPLFKKQASKAETAQVLADLLVRDNPTPTSLRARLPADLVDAIDYVTAAPQPAQPNATGN